MKHPLRGQGTKAAPWARWSVSEMVVALIAAVLFGTFLALGSWQVLRLQWKLELIERVAARVHAAPVPAPGPAQWASVTAATHEYRHVQADGVFDYGAGAAVQAVTELGRGFWVMTPLRRPDGSIVLVNRGFIAETARASAVQPGAAGVVTVTGLLRVSEPGGGFLRDNAPHQDRWHSRDVAAIGAARQLAPLAPYFLDADGGPAGAQRPPGTPVGGLTVIAFHNNHLVYALTWYALAAMVAGAFVWFRRAGRFAP